MQAAAPRPHRGTTACVHASTHLRQLAQAVARVEVGAVEAVVAEEAVVVELDLDHGRQRGLLQVAVVALQRQAVADEVNRLLHQVKLRTQFTQQFQIDYFVFFEQKHAQFGGEVLMPGTAGRHVLPGPMAW